MTIEMCFSPHLKCRGGCPVVRSWQVFSEHEMLMKGPGVRCLGKVMTLALTTCDLETSPRGNTWLSGFSVNHEDASSPGKGERSCRIIGVWREMLKGVENGHRLPNLRAAIPAMKPF
jgi:hypothetical protein